MHSFFVDHLITVKGLRPASVRSYRDTIRLLLCFVADDKGTKITRLTVDDLTFERIVGFLRHLEHDRGNHTRTRNQRLAATPHPVRLHRQPRPRDARHLPAGGRHPDEASRAGRDALPRTRRSRGASPTSTPRGPPRPAGPHAAAVPLQHRRPSARGRRPARRAPRSRRPPARAPPRQRRQVADLPPLAPDRRTARRAARVVRPTTDTANRPCSGRRRPAPHTLRHLQDRSTPRRHLDDTRTNRRVSPHIFRHTAAVHLLEAGVEVNVIRGWLGHADLTTTNRYAEINTKAKIEALRPPNLRVLRRDPAPSPSGGPTNRCSTGSPRSDRYVAEIGARSRSPP